jgi:hypothetical protein
MAFWNLKIFLEFNGITQIQNSNNNNFQIHKKPLNLKILNQTAKRNVLLIVGSQQSSTASSKDQLAIERKLSFPPTQTHTHSHSAVGLLQKHGKLFHPQLLYTYICMAW